MSDEPTARDDEDAPPAGGDDALHVLQARLDRASEAAERLIAEAAGRVSAEAAGRVSAEAPGRASAETPGREGPKPPPAGWQRPAPPPGEGGEPASAQPPPSELELLIAALRSLHDLIPPELQQRLAEALREVLLALRALIDWYLERTEERRRQPAEVQDIPIS